MNQDVKPFSVFLLLALFMALLGGKYWADGEAKAVRGFSFMHTHPNGDAYLLFDRQLFGFDAHGRPTAQIDLQHLKVEAGVTSDFAFFSNGDLLIRRYIPKQGFVHDLQRYFRFADLQDKQTDNSLMGLFRCNPSTYACRPFTARPLNLNNTFGLAIDGQRDRVFISDTSRHVLYLYAADGSQLDTAHGFYFPNQIHYQDGKLYVADTNHHQLAVMEIKERSFGNMLEVMDTRAGPAAGSGEIWPAAALPVDGRRWIRNATNGMNYGGIYVFDAGGQYQKRLRLPDDADPMSLLRLGDTVLVNDYSRDRIYRFGLQGEPLADFRPGVMEPALAAVERRRTHYQDLSRLFTAVFVLGLAGGFAAAIYQKRRLQQDGILPESPHAPAAALNDPAVHWLKPRLRFKLIVATFTLLLLFGLLLLPILSGLLEVPWKAFFKAYFSIYVLALLITVPALLQLRRKIGVAERHLIVVPPLGAPQVCAKTDLIYSGRFVVAGGTFFNIPQLYQIFSADEVEHLLYPSIKQGRLIGKPEMRVLLMRRQSTLLWLLVAAWMVGYFLYVTLKGV